jgi:hypothetical protein
MKKFNLAALPLAVAGVFASTSAFAGTEACFEVFKGDVTAPITDQELIYGLADCNARATAGTGSVTELATLGSASIAWETTGNVDINFNALGAVGLERTHIIYIPTTDVPPASRIKMKLNGADFGEDNANQIYLIKSDGTNYETVASSDGAFNNLSEIEFLTKAGVTISAGTRLLLSVDNPDGTIDPVNIDGINIHVANSETCAINPEVTIEATSALTDASTVIQGGISRTPVPILDISEQFELVANPQAKNEILVDAEDPSFRQQFVVSKVGGEWVGQVVAKDTGVEAAGYWETQFINNYDDFDLAVDIDPLDTISISTSATSSTGPGVKLSFLANVGANTQADLGNGTVLDAAEPDHLVVATDDDVVLLDINDSTDELISLTTTPETYSIDADEIFRTNASSDVYTVARLSNADDEVMEFNYEVNTTWSMDFDNDDLLDKNGCETPTPFEVGVNGAVLKVPYTYTKINEGGFVRITSEHNVEATIFMDIFDESSNEIKNVNLGLIQPKSSNVLLADALLASAIADGYTGTGDRHTMTFTVTAPKNKVHGVSVQKIAGGVDRVMPVLDQNDWSQ